MAINFDEVIILDAEELAEGGIKSAYDELLPELQKHIFLPAKLEETLDRKTPRYTVKCNGIEYIIYGPEIKTHDGWQRATAAFFAIINSQIGISTCRFYALYDGNDLCGIFLTPQQAQAAKLTIKNKMDWPYLPEFTPPWYGSYHD